VVAPFGGFALSIDDLSRIADGDREAAVRRRTGEEARRPFDLSRGPLFRATLLKLGGEDHVLLLSMHHIVSDGWSMGVLFRELATLYEAYLAGGESPLPELAVQYADYAVWQREQLEGEVLDRQLSYWTEQLAGAPELLELPTDHPRSPVRTYQGATVPVNFSPELLERLRALGRSEGTTLYMTVLSAFQVLLSKYVGSEDVVVGSPIAGRTRKEVEELIGFFVNTLVLRTDLSGDPGFREVLRRARQVTLGAYEHQEVPFERLVEELQPERSLSHSPLFQVMFTLQNAGDGGAGSTLPGLSVSGAGAELASAKFDLSLGLAATSHGLLGGLTYSTDLFEPGTVERMVRHLERVLEQVAADADVRLSRLELLGDAERALVLEEWNRTAAEVPTDRCIHELFAEQAERTPGAVAVVVEEAELTYAELDERANRLAHHLVRVGVGPEARVGVCLERGMEMIISLLAVLKAGGAYVPLDPAYPAERLAFTLSDSGVVALLTQESLRPALPVPDGVTVVSVDGAAAEIARESAERIESGATQRSLAYLIYTSGSTGVPKGVAIEHESAVALLSWAATVFTAEELSGMLAATSISFDLSVFEIFLPLARGGRVIVVENALALPQSAAADQVRLVNTVPSAIAALLKSGGIPSGVRTVNLAGEPLRAELVDALYARGGIERVYDLYGPSEDTTYSTWTLRRAGGPTTIGRPISNTRAYVLGAALQPMPAGVPGELYLGGRGLARGYLGRPGLTAERFVPDPFSSEPGARLYRTGDRARWRADGTLEYLGRLDAQVKVRGFRIELGEVEAALRRNPGVTDCVVLAREDAPGDRRLVAYVVGGADADALRAHLRQSLPEYMVPGAFVALEALPLTPNGKLDRKALPAPDLASAEETYVAPRTPVEEVLAGIWAEVLRLERVGVEESFFDLGGHSLLATRVVSRIRAVFGVELPLRALFEGPTIAEMAGRVEEMRRAELPVLPPVLPTGRTGALPLSFAQERLWFIDQLEPGSAVYNIPAARRLGGSLDQAALERALGEIVRRHDALRTVFAEVDGSPVQVVAPFGGFALSIDDLSRIADGDREAAVRRRTGEEARRPFDLSRGPLFRATLLRLGGEDHVLLLSMHHIVSDGWSMGVLFRELATLYEAYRDGGESSLPELAVQYADYAVWQREQLEGEVLDRQLSYWTEQLAGAPELLELPTDHPRPAVGTYQGATVPVNFSPELLQRLQALGRSEGATLYMTLLGAFQVLLSKYSGGEDVVVGSPIAGRTRGEVEALIGFFVNTLVLRTDLSGDPSFREVLRRVRAVTLGAYEHQEVPFEKLVAELQPERSMSHSPLFQVMFTLQNAGGGGSALPGLRVSGVGAEVASAKFDLNLAFAADSRALRAVLEYRTDLFEPGTIQRMLSHLERVLEQVAADADVRLSRLELLSAQERGLVVDAWNRTEAEYPADRCIHQLFEAQVARTPDAVAAIHEHDSLTYAELNARANRLAHHLGGLGVGPEVRVGICLTRGLDLLVSMLAVLKAGGAYVPLDPAYPRERLENTLADAEAPVLVTQETLRDVLPDQPGVSVVMVDHDRSIIDAAPAENVDSGVEPRNLAYLIYTSGSTGVPKGVAIQHESAVVMLSWAWNTYSEDELGGMLASTSISFDMSVFELFTPLARGGRIIIVENALALPSAPAADEVVLLDTVPSAAAALVKTGGIPASVRTINLGGEPLKAELVDELYAAGVERVYDLYGPSEDTTFSTFALRQPGGPVTIGRILSNSQAYVLDRALNPVPVGVPGELYLGGKGVTRGYLGRPSLTADRYVPDHIGGVPGARLYRSGDKIRWNPDGTLEYMGRLDEQVKIRGHRVELGEIESVLRRAGLADCVVVAREDTGETRLVAYVVGGIDPEALRLAARRTLPEYMVPAAFVEMEALPLTPNGKLDRKALPVPEHAADADRYVAPRTPVEEVLAGIWAEVLQVERVGVEDDFFDLGGHSLLATRAVSRIREAFRVELPLRALFEHPTVAALARRLEEERGGAVPLPPVEAGDRPERLPLSFAQERLWLLDQLQAGNTAYHVPLRLRLQGALDADALRRALTEVVRRHESLRTVFPVADGVAAQVVMPAAPVPLPVDDLGALDPDAREAQVRRRVREEGEHPFDLANGPLFRARLLRLGDEEHVLLASMHHIVTDGWSMGVVMRELAALYDAYRQDLASPLPEPRLQYADYALWQREHLGGGALAGQLAYWKEKLAGAPAVIDLPADRPRPPVQSFVGARERINVPPELATSLRGLARREGATLFMVLLAGWQLLLSRLAGQDDVVVGTPIAGRVRPEVEPLVGLFLNTLALRGDLSGDPTFREVVRRVRETTLEAYGSQDVPLERLIEELHPERTLSHTPLLQVMFNFLNLPPEDTIPGLTVSRVGSEEASAKLDLTLYLSEHGGGIGLNLVYNAELFDAPRAAEMLRQYAHLLAQAAADPDAAAARYTLVTAEAAARLPDPAARLNRRWLGSVPARFARQAARHPERVAVSDAHGEWSYAELDRQSAALAHRLHADGIGRGDVVAVYAQRSGALVWALLGVLRAGAAFMVIDPAYPASRQVELLRVANPRGWIALEEAGDVPDVVAAHLGSSALLSILRLPPISRAEPATARAPTVELGPDDLAYVAFTSGSTGMPKAVLGRHGPLTHFIPWLRSAWQLGPEDRFSMASGLAHDPLHRDVFTPLQLGAAVCVPRPDDAATPGRLAAWMREAGVTVAHLTPALGRVLTEGAPPRLDALRRVFLVGDVLTRYDVERLRGLAPGVTVVNYYGSTETQRAVGFFVPPAAGGREVVPLGRGIPGVSLLVVNRAGALAGVGEPGEVFLRSPHLAAGYLHDEALTRERFVPNPLTGADRAYRTGDLGRYLPDGAVEPLGRADRQVKVRGFRVEPGEVEAVLARHPAVGEAVVLPYDAAPGDLRLAAYVVPAHAARPPAPAELRAAAAEQLPDYMVPAAWVLLDALPLTPNGKLDRAALPAPVPAESTETFVAPRNATEEVLAGFWTELLGVERVGVEDDFFLLGGHSLLATRLLARVHQTLRVQVPLRRFFEAPTVAGVAAAVMETPGAARRAETIARLLRELDAVSDEEAEEMLGRVEVAR
jgi:amino acid adenylation domain-containing protein